jgi:tetratricopeptide (TPR) repeat protein
MYKKAILIVFVVLAVSSAIYALLDRKPVTTSSDEAYKAYQKGEEYSNKLFYREALQEYERAIKLDPQFAMAHMKAAKYYMDFDNREKYEESKKKALALLDKVKDIERLQILLEFARIDRDDEKIEQYSNELTERYPDHYEAVYIRAWSMFDDRNYREASKAYLRLLEIAPDDALAYNQLGYIHYFLGEYDKALEYLKKYAEMAAGQPNPHDSRGEILMNLGHYDEALREFTIADSIKPNLHFVVSHIGDVYAAKWMMRDAVGAYMKAAELAANERVRVDQYMKMASSYYYMDKPDESIAVLEEAAAKSADIIPLQARLGSFYALEGNMDNALVQLGIVKGLIAKLLAENTYPDSIRERTWPSQLFLESRIESARGNYRAAVDLLKQVLEYWEAQDRNYVLRRMAEEYNKAGMPDSAIVALKQVLDKNPNNALCLLRLSEAYEAKGMANEQMDALQRFLTVTNDATENMSLIDEARLTQSELESKVIN